MSDQIIGVVVRDALKHVRGIGDGMVNEIIRLTSPKTEEELIETFRKMGSISPYMLWKSLGYGRSSIKANKQIDAWINAFEKQGLAPDNNTLKRASNAIGEAIFYDKFDKIVSSIERHVQLLERPVQRPLVLEDNVLSQILYLVYKAGTVTITSKDDKIRVKKIKRITIDFETD